MTEEIIRLREELVVLSSDPIKTRELLDKLTEEEIFQHDIESPYHVSKNDIEEEKDIVGESGQVVGKYYRTNGGYCVHYYGGLTTYIDSRLQNTAGLVEQLMEGVPQDIADENGKESVEMVYSAAEQIFRLPMYVFLNMPTMLNVATMGLMLQNYLHQKGDVLMEETENPEYDKFLLQMNELLDNFAAGLEKEGKEYEKRNGLNNGEERKKAEGKGKDQSEREEAEQKGS